MPLHRLSMGVACYNWSVPVNTQVISQILTLLFCFCFLFFFLFVFVLFLFVFVLFCFFFGFFWKTATEQVACRVSKRITRYNRPLSNCVKTKEQRRSCGDKFSFSFVCTKENVNLSSQPRLCSFVLTQFKSGLFDILIFSQFSFKR